MFTKRIYLAGEQHGCVRLATRSQCEVESLLRANSSQCGRELAFADASMAEQIGGDAILERRQHRQGL